MKNTNQKAPIMDDEDAHAGDLARLREHIVRLKGALRDLIEVVNADENIDEHDLDGHDPDFCALCKAREVLRDYEEYDTP